MESGAYYSYMGIIGPMDRFMGSIVAGEEGSVEKITLVSAKEHQKQVCVDIRRFLLQKWNPF